MVSAMGARKTEARKFNSCLYYQSKKAPLLASLPFYVVNITCAPSKGRGSPPRATPLLLALALEQALVLEQAPPSCG